MKKIAATLLALAVVAGGAVPAFAADIAAPSTGLGKGDYGVNVAGKLGIASPGGPSTVVSADVVWESMDFVYHTGHKGTWDPLNHVYSGGVPGSWSTNKAGITVINHSNTAIDTSFQFQPNSGVTATGSFYRQNDDLSYTQLTGDRPTIGLGTAVGTDKNAAPADRIFFGVGGDAITEAQQLGTITVSITPTDKIYDANSLMQALSRYRSKGGTVTLDADIDMGSRGILEFSGLGAAGNPVVLDLNGHAVKGIVLARQSYVTIKGGSNYRFGTVGYGSEDMKKLDSSLQTYIGDGAVIVNDGSVLTLDHVRVLATDMIALANKDGETNIYTGELGGGLDIMNLGKCTILSQSKLLISDETYISDWTIVGGTSYSVTVSSSGAKTLNGTHVAPDHDETYTASSDISLLTWLKKLA